AEVFTVNVDQNLKLIGEPFVLKPFDIISIRNSETYELQKQVFLEGEVLYPGPYTIRSKNERISDLITRAGGLTSSAYTDGASLKRPGPPKTISKDKNAISLDGDLERDKQLTMKRLMDLSEKDESVLAKDTIVIASDLVGINLSQILKVPGSNADLILQEGDIIRIPKQLQTVKVSGEVLNPNNIVYMSNRGFKSYIRGAGGYNINALPKGAYIKYANGSVAAASNFLFFRSYPKVMPGAEILVPQRPKRERLNAQAWIGIGTAFASLAAVIVSILR
ncbi:MAG: capsule biosynthesis protein, partial [Pedobacter sp.]